MLSNEIKALEQENFILKEALKELKEKMSNNEKIKPKSCQYCKYFIQHYIRGGSPAYVKEYVEIYEGHCTRGVPICKGGKRKTTPNDTCPYFELGTHKTNMCL